MQSYYIQYPSIYPNHASPQRPIVASNNLVKEDVDCSKEVEKSVKQDSKYLQPRWCPSVLSHTQKEKAAMDVQEGVHGTTSVGYTSKVGDHEAGMED